MDLTIPELISIQQLIQKAQKRGVFEISEMDVVLDLFKRISVLAQNKEKEKENKESKKTKKIEEQDVELTIQIIVKSLNIGGVVMMPRELVTVGLLLSKLTGENLVKKIEKPVDVEQVD